jgi:hypothetical protein
VLVLVVTVNGFLYFAFYVPRMTTSPVSPPPIERTGPSSSALEKTRPTTDVEEETTTSTTKSPSKSSPESSPTATATASPSP